ncbi:DUF4179 domain-containing protein [Paenibacillus donghaensis]|uniref:DUF4179 domain-containing protein n=1 Tax=Paenibacillus donghaensis TaxID=414771 RepID=A0A2Z2KJ04_9BACL|nr:DUF4179 domain-containing protein [Paenibacillus donghaensis]ASA24145.1 hypothetical protein B9T62_27280 [Paenibacillus donghaensis]
MDPREIEELEQRLNKIKLLPAEELPAMIRERQEKTYALLLDEQYHPEKPQARKFRLLKRSAAGAAAAVTLLGVALLASGLASPVMAKTLERIPLVGSIFELAGDLGLKAANQQGLTAPVTGSDIRQESGIRATEVIYDGTRLVVGLKREGGDFSGSFHGLRLNADGTPKLNAAGESVFNEAGATGSLNDLKILIDGHPLNPEEDAPDAFKYSISPILVTGPDEQSLIMQFSEQTYAGGGQLLPDAFTLTLQMEISGLEGETFTLDLPVHKDTSHNIVLLPKVSRMHDNITATVEKLTLAPTTTQIRISDIAEQNISKQYLEDTGTLALDHEVYDDQGNLLRIVNGGGGWSETDQDQRYTLRSDVNLEPLEDSVKSITVRTYIYKYTGTGREKRNRLDSAGNPVKEYIPQLDMTIPIR